MIPPSRLPRPSSPDVSHQDDDSATMIGSDTEDFSDGVDSDVEVVFEAANDMERLADELLKRPPIFVLTDDGRWKEPTPEVRAYNWNFTMPVMTLCSGGPRCDALLPRP